MRPLFLFNKYLKIWHSFKDRIHGYVFQKELLMDNKRSAYFNVLLFHIDRKMREMIKGRNLNSYELRYRNPLLKIVFKGNYI